MKKTEKDDLTVLLDKVAGYLTGGSQKYFYACRCLHRASEKAESAGKSLLKWYEEMQIEEREAQRMKSVGRVFRKTKADHVVGYRPSHLWRLAALSEVGRQLVVAGARINCKELDYLKEHLSPEQCKSGDRDAKKESARLIRRYRTKIIEKKEKDRQEAANGLQQKVGGQSLRKNWQSLSVGEKVRLKVEKLRPLVGDIEGLLDEVGDEVIEEDNTIRGLLFLEPALDEGLAELQKIARNLRKLAKTVSLIGDDGGDYIEESSRSGLSVRQGNERSSMSRAAIKNGGKLPKLKTDLTPPSNRPTT